MKKIILVVLVATLFFACNTEKKQPTWDENKVFEVAQVLAKPDSFVNKMMKVKGTVTHICKHGGKKMFIMGETEEQTLRCDAGKDLAQFDASKTGSEAIVTGVFLEEKVNEAFLAQWEQEEKDELAKNTQEATTPGKENHKESCAFENTSSPTLERINKIRQEIKTNGKGYISWYSFEAKSYEIAKQ